MICVMHVAMSHVMNEKAERLRQARIKAGYRFASDAANALGIVASTYRAHENGQNEFEFAEAKIYARKFNVDPVWLMGGVPDVRIGISIPIPKPTEIEPPNAGPPNKVVGQGKKIPVFGQRS